MKTNFYNLLFTVLGIVCMTFTTKAQSELSHFNFTNSWKSIASKVLALSDGSFLLIGGDGDENDFTKSNMVVIKTDANHNPIWSKSYATPNYSPLPFKWFFGNVYCNNTVEAMEYAVDAVEVADGYIILGTYDDFKTAWPFCGENNHTMQSTFNYVVMKISKSNGNVLWTKKYGASGNQIPTSIQKTSDGGFIIGGYTKGGALNNGNYGVKPYFLKIAANGLTQWSKVQNGFNFQFISGVVAAGFKFPIIELQSGGYAYVASTGNETYIVKLNSNGSFNNAKVVSHEGSNGFGVGPLVDDNYNIGLGLLAGYTTQFFTPTLKEITSGPNQGGLIMAANLNFAFASFLGLLFNAGNDNIDGGAVAGMYSWKGGLLMEIDDEFNYVNGSIFWHETGNTQGDLADLHVSDLALQANGDVLITGVAAGSSYIMNFDKNVVGTLGNESFRSARLLNSFNYSQIPFSYDLPSTVIKNTNVVSVSDNFEIMTTPLLSSSDNCTPSVTVKAIAGDNPGISSISESSLYYTATAFPESALTMIASNLSVSKSTDCNSSSPGLRTFNQPQVEVEKTSIINGLLEFNVYPNPAYSNNVQIKWNSVGDADYLISVVDVKGQVISQYNGVSVNGENIKTINDDLSNGIYFIELQLEGQTYATKLMKQ